MESYVVTGKGISDVANIDRTHTVRQNATETQTPGAGQNTDLYGTGAVLDVTQNKMRVYGEVMQERLDVQEAVAAEENGQIGQEADASDVQQTGSVSTSVTGELLFMEKLLEQMQESRAKTSSTENGTKALNYSYRKVSAAIARAKNVNQAGNALTSAKSTLAALKRKAASGNYKSDEVQIAINHAKKMVRTAKKKVRNIRLEVQTEQSHKSKEGDISREQRQKLLQQKQQIARKKSEQEQELTRLKKQWKRERSYKKNSHRRDESQELLEADMEFLHKQIQMLKQEGNAYTAESVAMITVTETMSVGEVAGDSQSTETGSLGATEAVGTNVDISM